VGQTVFLQRQGRHVHTPTVLTLELYARGLCHVEPEKSWRIHTFKINLNSSKGAVHS
jgi:hypothetical protein